MVQQDSAQVPALQNEEVTPVKETDAIIFEIPLRDEPKPVVPSEEVVEDAIFLEIPVGDKPSPIVGTPIEVQPGTLIGDLFALSDSQSQSETEKLLPNKIADEVAVKIPVASAPVVQQDDIQVKPQQVVAEEVKPDKLIVAQEIVVEAPVQSDPVAQPDKNQVQLSLQDEPSVLEQEKVVANDAYVIDIPYESDEYAQEDAYSQDDAAKPEFDPSEIFNPPIFNFQKETADDEIYTEDAVIIDAAGDPFSSDSTLESGNKDWGKAESQDAASDFLNAMLQEYLNQFYGNSNQQVEIEENSRSKIGDDLRKSDPYYYSQEIPEEDDLSAVVDYQRMSPEDSSNDNEYVISLEDLYEYFQQLKTASEDRARSKVDDSIQDQDQINEELGARLIMDLAEKYNQQQNSPKKENSKFESDNQSYDYVIDESLMRELYYQQWLNAQQDAQQEAMYYAIYPESAYYYR